MKKKIRILCEVFGLFDKRGASEGGTPYIIRGAWGLGAYKGAAKRRLTGGRKYAPKGNGKDEKEKKKACKRKKKERKGGKRWEGEHQKGEKSMQKKKEKEEKREKRGMGTAQK